MKIRSSCMAVVVPGNGCFLSCPLEMGLSGEKHHLHLGKATSLNWPLIFLIWVKKKKISLGEYFCTVHKEVWWKNWGFNNLSGLRLFLKKQNKTKNFHCLWKSILPYIRKNALDQHCLMVKKFLYICFPIWYIPPICGYWTFKLCLVLLRSWFSILFNFNHFKLK